MKKIITVLVSIFPIALLFFVFNSNTVLASENISDMPTVEETHNHSHNSYAKSENKDGLITPFYIACPGGGKHYMIGNGRGTVISTNGTTLLKNKACFRCSKCGLIIIAENNPILGAKYLGRYATGSGPNSHHTHMRVRYSSYSSLPFNGRLGGDSFTQSLSWE